MKLIRAVSCWGNQASPVEALGLACEWGFEAVEGPAEVIREIAGEGMELIAEIVTGCDSGSYVPGLKVTPDEHLEDFRRKLDLALDAEPLRITTMAGSDFWDFPTACRFFEDLLGIAEQRGAKVCIETHRARPTFHLARTRRFLEELPNMKLTLDVSHWCVVCERLMPGEVEWMESIQAKVGHLHTRVGYDQGPQVPDPRVERYGAELAAHLECWKRIAERHQDKGAEFFTVTPEFGPDGYLQSEPSSGRPAADLREINRWIGGRVAQLLEESGMKK
ncbi:sugar phosphate isomerase/epimerase family protein [Luteolibacter marinus]|uniref:sugar phosphate isomerase/epimerase family protein n=1 Tax=Luteolibacter marinus TaxID=2776705 RepID=UPI001865F011|nr:sugar phosphate isomerase/epimerase [Luteolibacter marinus]